MTSAGGGALGGGVLGGGAGGDGHTHDNKAALDSISTDMDGYQYLTRLVEVEDETTDEETGETTTSTEWQAKKEKVKAGYADTAGDLAEDSAVWGKVLRKDKEDETEHLLKLKGGVEIGGFRRNGTAETPADGIDGNRGSDDGLTGEGTAGTDGGGGAELPGSETAGDGGGGAAIDADGNADVGTLAVRGDAAVGGVLDVTGDLVARKGVGTADFASGFGGYGWRSWRDGEGVCLMETDVLTVRQRMRIYELLIEKIRSVGGQVVVSAANGKIKEVTDNGDYWSLYMEDGGSCFAEHDLLRVAHWNKQGMEYRSYWVEVRYVNEVTGAVGVLKSDMDEWDCEPMAGDECVLMGNTTDRRRQNLILISATEDGQPRMDVLNGVSGRRSMEGCLRARVGNLDGIRDDRFEKAGHPVCGDGLYSDNAYLRGVFVLLTGEDVATKFAVTEGLIQMSVEGLRTDFMTSGNYLKDATFESGGKWWMVDSGEVTYWLAGQDWIWVNGTLLSKKDGVSTAESKEGRTEFHIVGGSVKQLNGMMAGKPELAVDADGKKVAARMRFSMMYKCKSAGVLTVQFTDADTGETEDSEYAPWNPVVVMEKSLRFGTEEYMWYECECEWNGTGDFVLGYTGELWAYMICLRSDSTDKLWMRYRTLFEQSEKMLRIAAENFDEEGQVVESSEIMTEAGFNKIMSRLFDDEGCLKNTSGLVTTGDFAGLFSSAMEENDVVTQAEVSTFVQKDENGYIKSGVRIKGDQVTVEGMMSVNGKFKIREDGTMEASGGSFSGVLKRRVTEITATEVDGYVTRPYEDIDWLFLDLDKCGSMVRFVGEGFADLNLQMVVPGIYPNGLFLDDDTYWKAREYIGTEVTIYNSSDGVIGVTGNLRTDENAWPVSFGIGPGSWCYMRCECSGWDIVENKAKDYGGMENVYWRWRVGSMKST